MFNVSKYSFNKKLRVTLLVISGILTARLLEVAANTDNWRGFWFSFAHILVVAVGTYYAIRRNSVGHSEITQA